MDWFCALENKIAIMPHLFPQVNLKISFFFKFVNIYFDEKRIYSENSLAFTIWKRYH